MAPYGSGCYSGEVHRYLHGVLDVEGPASEDCDLTSESPLFIGASVRVV